MSTEQVIATFLINSLDFVSVTALISLLTYTDHRTRREIPPKQWEKFEKIHASPEFLNITTNIAARSIQAGIAVGGFTFAALFSILFRPDILPEYKVDILIAFIWTMVSIFAGVTNISFLPTYTLTDSFVVTRMFGNIHRMQFCTLLGSFIRMTTLVFKSLSI